MTQGYPQTMTRIRDGLIQTLWRGNDPFTSRAAFTGPLDLQGWSSQHPYLAEAITAVRPLVIVEVGVWKGGSTIHMASKLKQHAIDGVVIAIDTWLGSSDHWVRDRWFHELGYAGGPNLFEIFANNVRLTGLADYIVPLPLDLVNAAELLRHFDVHPNMVHIDAGHDYAAVSADLRQWWPALTPGGIMIGDDYRQGNDWPEVKRAFDDYFEPLGLLPIENISDKCRLAKPIKPGPTEPPNPSDKTGRAAQDFATVAADVRRWREQCRIEFASLAEDDTIGLQDLIRRYVAFIGPKWEGTRHRIMDNIVAKLKATGLHCTRNDIFTEDGAIRPEGPSHILNASAARYPTPDTITKFKQQELLAISPNPYWPMALPRPIGKNMARNNRPALNLYTGNPGLDLFVSPLGFQLCDEQRGVCWPQAATRAYPSDVFSLPESTVNSPLVIIQDLFEGTNFSHFLFDWLPRLAHFLGSNAGAAPDCVFLMGGAPSQFHCLLVDSMCAMFSLNRARFIFPTRPEMWRLKGPVYFFSDLKPNMHPAHMAHEKSINLIRELAASIPTGRREFKRLYISRSDTPLRQLANEAELWRSLRPLGFAMVCLSGLSVIDQIELVRGAEIIVAPHGMGLTHIAFHDGSPLIIELHHPVVGTDAYAFIARALGFKFQAIVGTCVEAKLHHLEIKVADVMNALSREGISRQTGPVGDLEPVPEPMCRWFGGAQEVKAHAVTEIPPMAPVEAVLKHVRGTADDNNVGWTEASGLKKGVVYSAACDVWIPTEFHGANIALQSGALSRSPETSAEMTRRNQWQTITITGAAKSDLANFVLRAAAIEGGTFYSTRWRVAIGPQSIDG